MIGARQSNPKAQTLLGAMYATGHCVGRDLPNAYRWFAKALTRRSRKLPTAARPGSALETDDARRTIAGDEESVVSAHPNSPRTRIEGVQTTLVELCPGG